ncbi:unnamed protein product [Adineta steineri]|uniref:Uncharacterized protein n=1 Tax=Adineta steineri TaxID=433720 RepID=A0A818UEY2_9BILA|nr:unnamed protein product [Adineta steineri]
MATSTEKKQSPKNGLALVWLDDNSGQDPEIKTIFLSLFEQVFFFTDPTACLELIESAEPEPPCISILISGKYGHMLVPTRLQPLNQVKDIYVYCMDIVRHNQWAQQCDKVQCVDSDFPKILKHIQNDILKITKQNPQPMEVQNEQEQEQQEYIPKPLERFKDDNNIYDQLALNLLLQNSDDNNDGAEDFENYCQIHEEENDKLKNFKPDLSIKEWHKRDLSSIHLNSTDSIQLWTLRWFIRSFYRQIIDECNRFIKDTPKFTVNYGTWLTTDELDGMKHRIGDIIIFTEFLITHAHRDAALNSIVDKKDEKTKYKVIFEINVDAETSHIVPYCEIETDQVLFWFGSRYRIMKIEFIEREDPYWLIGMNICSTLNKNQSIQNLYEYYLNDLNKLNNIHHGFGRILMYKSLYYQAEKWFENTNHYEELAELAIRQNHCEQANQYLEKLPEDSHDANLLRAYVNILTSDDNITKGRTILMKIISDATDKIVRARANIALGFISLTVTQQIDQALEHFTLGNDTLCKNLPDIHPDIAKSFIGIGYTYFVRHDINQAEKSFQTAFDIQKQCLPYKHYDFARTRNGLGHCLAIQKQTMKQALSEFGHAINILIRTFRKEYKKHPEVLLTRIDIERVQKGKELGARNTILDYI